MVKNQEETGFLKKPSFITKLIQTGQMTRFIVYLSAIIPAIIFVILALFSFFGFFAPSELKFGEGTIYIGTWYDFVVLALIVGTGIFGFYEFLRLRKVRKIDERFPDFIRDLAESRRAGMTFTRAIMYSSKGNYGVLTEEIQKISRQISWGSSVEDALRAFSKRINTKLVKRTISLIIEASRSGGNVADVLDAASKNARELKLIDSERRTNMMAYVAVVYVGMFVFLLIIVILSKTLIPSMLGTKMSGDIGMGGSSDVSPATVTLMFFTANLVQSGFMGVITGVFEEGNVISGVKHVFIMLLITWIVFKFIVMGI